MKHGLCYCVLQIWRCGISLNDYTKFTTLQEMGKCRSSIYTIEYNLPPTHLLYAMDITVEKPKFHNFRKNCGLFFWTWADNVSRNNTTDCSPCPYIIKPNALSVFNGPFAKCLCPTRIPYWQKKNIWRYFSPLPHFYILYEIMLVTNSKSMEMIRNFEVISN
jgi:hypothetical protein